MTEEKPQIVHSEVPFKGKKLEVVRQTVLWPGGRESVIETIVHPGAVAILAIAPDGRVLLERQYRHSVKDFLYEIPAGTLEQGEDPEECASRELLEETGYKPDSLKKVGAIYPAPGYSSEVLHLFIAKVSKAGRQRLEDDESISISLHNLEEAIALINKGTAFDGKSALLLNMALADPEMLS
jgi:ADP-ribose pyrophosphatase